MKAAQIAALASVAILALTFSVRAGIGMWNHAHPERPHSAYRAAHVSPEGVYVSP